MKHIKFYVDAMEEVVEFDDDATEEEIYEQFEMWLDGSMSSGWYEEDEELW